MDFCQVGVGVVAPLPVADIDLEQFGGFFEFLNGIVYDSQVVVAYVIVRIEGQQILVGRDGLIKGSFGTAEVVGLYVVPLAL